MKIHISILGLIISIEITYEKIIKKKKVKGLPNFEHAPPPPELIKDERYPPLKREPTPPKPRIQKYM